MRFLTYLIYILAWQTFCLGGAAYVVFVLNRSGWWFLLGIILSSCAAGPDSWAKLDARGKMRAFE